MADAPRCGLALVATISVESSEGLASDRKSSPLRKTYRDSVEDAFTYQSLGKVWPTDILRDVWIDVAQGRVESARQLIDSLPEKHPFDLRWNTKIERCLGKPARQS